MSVKKVQGQVESVDVQIARQGVGRPFMAKRYRLGVIAEGFAERHLEDFIGAWGAAYNTLPVRVKMSLPLFERFLKDEGQKRAGKPFKLGVLARMWRRLAGWLGGVGLEVTGWETTSPDLKAGVLEFPYVLIDGVMISVTIDLDMADDELWVIGPVNDGRVR